MQLHDTQQPQSAHLRWKAITQRDPKAHGSFFYGVKTTRIYCRPTCTARVARRANVVYFDTPAQARLDGFRPCTKCKPDDATFLGQREEIVMRTLGLLRDDVGGAKFEGGLKALAQEVGVTPSYLCRVFKIVMGCTLGQYCKQFEEVSVVVHEAAALSSPTISNRSGPGAPGEPSKAGEATANPPESVEHCRANSHDHCAPPSRDCSPSFGMDMSLNFDDWLWSEELVHKD